VPWPSRLAPAFLTLLAGCAADPTTAGPLLTGSAERSCGPTDGPAVAMDLLTGTGESLKLYLYHGRDALAGRRVFVTPGWTEGGATLCPAAGRGPCQPATGGVIRVDRAGAVITGALSLGFPGTAIEGPFRATWREVAILCG